MAFGTKYRVDFIDDRTSTYWRCDIQEDSYAGAVTELDASGDPLTIEWLADGEDKFTVMKGSIATISCYQTIDFQLAEIFNSDPLTYKVIIYRHTSFTSMPKYWIGYVDPSLWSEPYEKTPYVVNITAADGVGILKNIPYQDSGSDYEDYRTHIQILYD